jgi:GT2 family glycosyltransferase
VPWVTGAFMMIDVDLFERIGLLDEEHYVHFGSDREFCKKASEQGFPTMCSPLALQHYYGWSTRPYIIHEDLPSIIQERIQKYGLGN